MIATAPRQETAVNPTLAIRTVVCGQLSDTYQIPLKRFIVFAETFEENFYTLALLLPNHGAILAMVEDVRRKDSPFTCIRFTDGQLINL